jgi:hypothetical protein
MFLLAALLAPTTGCPSSPDRGAEGSPEDEGDAAEEEGAQGPTGRKLLRLERGLVLWFDAHTPRDGGHPMRVGFFVARGLRGGLFLESLGLGGSKSSIRLVADKGVLWLFPIGEGRVNAASRIYHPVTNPGREIEIKIGRRRVRGRYLSHREGGVEIGLWFAEGEGLWKLQLNLEGKEELRLERSGKARWGSRPAPYPAATPQAAWTSVAKAVGRLDVVGLRQLMTPELWARLLPPGEGLTFPEGAIDGKRRLELIRHVVPQLLEVELEVAGEFEVQAGQAVAPAVLRTRVDGALNEADAHLDLIQALEGTEERWLWSGFRPRGEGTDGG